MYLKPKNQQILQTKQIFMYQEKIRYNTSRDFGETFNVSIRFIRQNFKLFFQSLLLIAGPFIVLSAICYAYYQWDQMSVLLRGFTHIGSRSPFSFIQINNLSYILYVLSAAISNLVLMGVIYAFVLVYGERGPGNFTVGDVARRLRQSIGGMIGMFFLFNFLFIITVGLIAGTIYLLGNVSGALVVLAIFALIVAMLLVLPNFIWQYSMAYLVKMQDNDLMFDAFGRTREAMRGNYWWTWLIVVSAFIFVFIAAAAFGTPLVIFGFAIGALNIGRDSQLFGTVFFILTFMSSFFGSLLYSVVYIVSTFHFYSLVEKKEGTGLLERIDEIGQTPVNTNPYHAEQQY